MRQRSMGESGREAGRQRGEILRAGGHGET